MRWWPRSISGQLLALWLLAMVVAHLIAAVTLSWWKAENMTLHPMSARTIEARIFSTYQAVVHSNDADTLLADINLPDSRFYLATEVLENPRGMEKQERDITEALHQMLNLPPEVPVHVRLSQVDYNLDGIDQDNWLERAFRGVQAWSLHVDILLPDGRWLRSEHWPTILPARWSRVLSFSILISMIPSAIIAILFGRRIMRPLRELTEASRRLSRGEYVELARPSGPEGIREITRAFNDMQKSLGKFIQGRTQMIAAIGHDLRTPLTSLRIQAEFIEDGQLRDSMARTLDDMGVIVEGTLQFARNEALQEPTQDVPINALVNEVVESQRIQGKDIRWHSQVSDNMFYRCRPVHLKRAIGNLVSNAACYGSVAVDAILSEEEKFLRIEVADNGPGIDPSQIELVFEPFVRLDAARHQDQGSIGLGLSIARTCIRAHGGEISLHNRQEGGLRAVIELPL